MNTDKPDAVEIRDNRQLMKERSREVCRVCGSIDVHVDHYGQPTVKCIGYLRDERNRVTTERDALKREVEAARERLQDFAEDVAYQYAYERAGCLTTGGLSTMETTFNILGWDDPHKLGESK